MSQNKENQPERLPFRKMPLAITGMTSIFFFIMSIIRNDSSVLLSLFELSFTILLMLALIFLVNSDLDEKVAIDEAEDNIGVGAVKIEKSKQKYFVKTFEFLRRTLPPLSFSDDDEDYGVVDQAQASYGSETEPSVDFEKQSPDELIAINKIDKIAKSDSGNKHSSALYSFTYVFLFTGLAVWRGFRVFTVSINPDVWNNYQIFDAIIILIFSGTIIVYLKTRNNNRPHLGDETTAGLLALFSYVALLYAAIIAVVSVLGVNIIIVLQWLFYAASFFIIIAMAVNILISVLKKNVINDFNYVLIPKLIGQQKNLLNADELKVNFSLKSLYTLKYMLKILPFLTLSLGLVLFLSTAIIVVQPHQQAAIYRFGRLDEASIVGEGLHVILPWPIERAQIFDVHRINTMQIGFDSAAGFDNLWTRFHDGEEHMLLLGGGNEMVAVNITVVYRISDLFAFVTTTANPEAILSAAVYESLLRRTMSSSLDVFLSVDRNLLSTSIHDELIILSKDRNLGLEVVQIVIEGIHPPVEVADVYQSVVTAALERNTVITNAETEAAVLLIDAQRQSATVVEQATARQTQRVSEAKREMAVFLAAVEAYQINPASFRLIRHLNTFEQIVRQGSIYLFSPTMEDSIPNTVIGNQNILFPWMR